MRFDVVSLFPEFFVSLHRLGVVGQAFGKSLLELHVTNPRQFTHDKHQTVDDRPFGGGDGMILKPEPLAQSVEVITRHLQDKKAAIGPRILLSAQGQPLDFKKVQNLAQVGQVTLICGRYGGLDQRFINQYVDEEISIGDYILSGGELAAAVLIDAVARWIPGVVGDPQSLQNDSFYRGGLEFPLYTRPREFQGQNVPEILLGGDHGAIAKFNSRIATLWTLRRRPDLIGHLTPEQVVDAQAWEQSLSEEELRVLGLSPLIKS